MIFKDREEAGKMLAGALGKYKNDSSAIVLGLPRGGVVLSYEVAKKLGLPMDIIATRKIGAPDNPEFAIGAITETGTGFFDSKIIALYSIEQDYIDNEIEKEKKEALRRLEKYRENRPPLNLQNKTALLVDDGIATGATMRAAIISAKEKGAEKIIVAVPTIARDTLKTFQKEADELIYLDAPEFFDSVGSFYEIFPQIKDEEVIEIMNKT